MSLATTKTRGKRLKMTTERVSVALPLDFLFESLLSLAVPPKVLFTMQAQQLQLDSGPQSLSQSTVRQSQKMTQRTTRMGECESADHFKGAMHLYQALLTCKGEAWGHCCL